MLITNLRIDAVDLPMTSPLRTAMHEIASVGCLLVTIETDCGVVGEGYGFCFGIDRLRVIAGMAATLRDMVVGRDPHDVEAMWKAMFRGLNFYGQAGIAILAMSPIDIACWDAIGKAAEAPLYKLFGACRHRVPVYASGGLWLSSNPDELRKEARKFLADGFKAMKLRLGSKRWQDDVLRVEAVRDEIGPNIALMVDANQGLSAVDALKLGRSLEAFDLTWFEEPLPTWDDSGTAALARALDTPIASGETEYTRYGIRRMAENAGVDIFMPDLQRMGGYTEMRRTVQYLAAQDLPVAPHIFTEHSLHVVASAPNAIWCEHMPWFEPLFREHMTIDDEGLIALPSAPGVGFTFDWDNIESYRVDVG